MKIICKKYKFEKYGKSIILDYIFPEQYPEYINKHICICFNVILSNYDVKGPWTKSILIPCYLVNRKLNDGV